MYLEDPTLGKVLKKYATRYYQLTVGHGAIGIFLARIGLSKPRNVGGVEHKSRQLFISTRNAEDGEESGEY